MEEVARFLSEHPPFSLLTSEQVQRLANAIQIEFFAAGQDILIRDGTPAEYLYIIRRGSVDLITDENQEIQIHDTLTEGESFAHPSLIRGKSPILTVRAREDVLAYLLPASRFHQSRREIPIFARFYATSAIERMSNAPACPP